ncbi:unnamed protein product, partial [Didymodactylos carnosus]
NGMMRSRLTRKNLLNGYRFLLKCDGCPPIYSNNQNLIELIKLCGGICLQEIKDQPPNTVTIVLCQDSFLVGKRELYEQCQHIYISFLKPEWLLASVTKYLLEPMEDYEVVPS